MVWHDNFRSIAKNMRSIDVCFTYCRSRGAVETLCDEGKHIRLYELPYFWWGVLSRFSETSSLSFVGDLVCWRKDWHFQLNYCWGFSASEILFLKFVSKLELDFCWRIFVFYVWFVFAGTHWWTGQYGGVSPLLSWLLLPFSGGMLISWEYFLTMIFGF